MASWIKLSCLERKDFFTLADKYAINYLVIKDNIISDYNGLIVLSDYPSLSECRKYIQKEKNESNDSYYERAIHQISMLKSEYAEFMIINEISTKEQVYLEEFGNYQELFFDKRNYALEEKLMARFSNEFESSKGLPIVLTDSNLEIFNQIVGTDFIYDNQYIYALSIG